ncbi:hypothetical protein EVAR_3134_1 [Eumeta japonica]|uniref:Uncharacterized protein n=1 Tax=Eumeta variegata TaxID=151549 RepID=A0A4C1XHF8_EUMVA|nr:hypothetical protein EVAR_3134_1 [Eumeta japonica]
MTISDFIPNKPDKYDIKFPMTCDATFKYMIDADPYIGRTTNSGGVPLVKATILAGPAQGGTVLAPRVPPTPQDLPFEFKRLQFLSKRRGGESSAAGVMQFFRGGLGGLGAHIHAFVNDRYSKSVRVRDELPIGKGALGCDGPSGTPTATRAESHSTGRALS